MNSDPMFNYEGDFIRDANGRPVTYKGPIFLLTYPKSENIRLAAACWSYFCHAEIYPYSADSCNSIKVYAGLPKQIQKNLKNAGITVRKIKDRGPQVEI